MANEEIVANDYDGTEEDRRRLEQLRNDLIRILDEDYGIGGLQMHIARFITKHIHLYSKFEDGAGKGYDSPFYDLMTEETKLP